MYIQDMMLKDKDECVHTRMDEICQVLDDGIDYDYEHTTNLERVKLILSDYKYNKSYISKNLLILNGKVKLIPDIDIKQGFICLLMILDKKQFSETIREYKLITYEPDSRLYPKF